MDKKIEPPLRSASVKSGLTMAGGRFDDLGVVVRGSGERTIEACCGLLAELFGESVHRVSGRPFSATLRKSLELGTRLGRPWTLCVDADVLALPALATFIAEARALPRNTFAVQALVLDKLLPVRRPAGNHLYRTELLNLALSRIPSEDMLRPEYEMIRSMCGLGHGFYQSRLVVGLHDFEQSYADLFAKAYLHGHKHRSLEDQFLLIWQSLSDEDADYAVAFAAWKLVEDGQGMPRVCRDHTDALMLSEGVQFEEKLPFARFAMTDVESLLKRAIAPDPRIDVQRAYLQEKVDQAVFHSAPRFQRSAVRLKLRWRELRMKLFSLGSKIGRQ